MGWSLSVADYVATIVLDTPRTRNALTLASFDELAVTVDELGRRDDVRVVVLTGAGEQAFCAGMDLHDLARPESSARLATMPLGGAGRSLFEILLTCPKPTMAAVNGLALGAGLELALACDLRIAVRGAMLGLPEARRGMGAHFASHVLPRLVNRALAMQMLYTGEPIDADTALAWGLINQIAETGAPFTTIVDEWSTRLASNAPLTLQRYKAAVTAGLDQSVFAALRLDVGPNPYRSNDRLEGIAAWRERRAPRWTAT